MEKNFVTQQINYIESEVYRIVKPLGFTKHGRTLHRFVSEDISQVINFQCGQAYLNTTHLLSVNIGIRIPECFERQFHIANDKTYYHEYECNLRTRLGIVKTKKTNGEKVYNLEKDVNKICDDIVHEIEHDVLPVFNLLSSREAILKYRREYPWFDTMNSHLILLEEAMIYGHLNDLQKAKELFDEYYNIALQNCKRCPGHIDYLNELKGELGFFNC
ncbi:MAG: DUF4304 domain-containing protein [Clostridia bacterium]|nr:DUF4304 domain-containing protein [Clostridia bacterium]